MADGRGAHVCSSAPLRCRAVPCYVLTLNPICISLTGTGDWDGRLLGYELCSTTPQSEYPNLINDAIQNNRTMVIEVHVSALQAGDVCLVIHRLLSDTHFPTFPTQANIRAPWTAAGSSETSATFKPTIVGFGPCVVKPNCTVPTITVVNTTQEPACYPE